MRGQCLDVFSGLFDRNPEIKRPKFRQTLRLFRKDYENMKLISRLQGRSWNSRGRKHSGGRTVCLRFDGPA